MLPDRENLFKTMAALVEAGENTVDHENENWSRYGETVAILILDSSGFTRVTESHGIVHFLSQLMQLRDCKAHF